MQKTILHIDFDSYFASCEQQFNPSLRGKPIGVTATNGRHCIIAASREAKKLGVKSPSATWEASNIVPEIIFVPGQFRRYWEITQKFINICKDYSPYVEIFSLDEVFMDISSTQFLYKDKYEIVRIIKERIKNEIGEYITVSVGMSSNKLLAKLGSGLNKPNGFCEITKENLDEIYKKCKLTDICGIGERIAVRLNKIGIYSLLDLRQIPFYRLKLEFGNVEAKFLQNVGFGIDDSIVIPYYLAPETKSVGRNYCLPQNEYEFRVVLQNVYELSEEIALKLRRLGKLGKTVFFYLGGSKSVHGSKTINQFESGKDIFKACLTILEENGFEFNTNDYIRRISVGASNLSDGHFLNLNLFENLDKKHKILKIVDKINDRFGDYTIRNGFLLYADKLKTVPNGFMADRFERVKFAQNTTF